MESSYKLKKKLGRGSFGDVFLVEDEYHWVYAMKEIPLKNLEIKEYKTFYF